MSTLKPPVHQRQTGWEFWAFGFVKVQVVVCAEPIEVRGNSLCCSSQIIIGESTDPSS